MRNSYQNSILVLRDEHKAECSDVRENYVIQEVIKMFMIQFHSI